MPKDAERILDELGALVRQLARITGGPEDTLSLTGTQRLAVYELGADGRSASWTSPRAWA